MLSCRCILIRTFTPHLEELSQAGLNALLLHAIRGLFGTIGAGVMPFSIIHFESVNQADKPYHSALISIEPIDLVRIRSAFALVGSTTTDSTRRVHIRVIQDSAFLPSLASDSRGWMHIIRTAAQ